MAYKEIVVEYVKDGNRIRHFHVEQVDQDEQLDLQQIGEQIIDEVGVDQYEKIFVNTTSKHQIPKRDPINKGVEPKYKDQFTHSEFLSLFSRDESVAMREQRDSDANIADLLDRLDNEPIRVDDPDIIAGVEYLAEQEIIDQQKANRILEGRVR